MRRTWTCSCCGREFDDVPMSWGSPAPPAYFELSEDDKIRHAILTDDICVIHDREFYVRGAIELRVTETDQTFVWFVWVSLSEASMRQVGATWDDDDRHVKAGPFFGWLCSPLPYEPETYALKTSVVLRPPPLIPLIELETTEHPLAVEQARGIAMERVIDIAQHISRH